MARTKRTSSILETARQRLAGLKSITPALDFGSSLTLSDYEAEITELTNRLDDYNEKLSALDSLQNTIDSLEAGMREMNVRFLSAAEARYGPDSSEYEQAGGTRRSERKRTGPKGPRTGQPAPPTS